MTISGIELHMMMNNATRISGEVSSAQKSGEVFQAYLAKSSKREVNEKATAVERLPDATLDKLITTANNLNKKQQRKFKKKASNRLLLDAEKSKLDITI